MKRAILAALLVAQAFASCPVSVKCEYHNVFFVYKVESEWRNGKEFGIQHDYTDEKGRQRKCRLIVECAK